MLRKNIIFSLTVLSFLLIEGCKNQSQESFNKILWLEGEWIRESDNELSLETWKLINPGKLEGNGYVFVNEDTVFSEKMFIEIINSEIVFTAIPSGKMATQFKLVSQKDKRLEFENPEHDFPKKIIYWQEEVNSLNAQIEGKVNNSTKLFDYSWKRRIFE